MSIKRASDQTKVICNLISGAREALAQGLPQTRRSQSAATAFELGLRLQLANSNLNKSYRDRYWNMIATRVTPIARESDRPID